MRLAAVMGLVIEQVREGRCQRLFEHIWRCDTPITDHAGQIGVAQGEHLVGDAPVFCFARLAQRRQSLMQDRVEPVDGGAQ